jgi:predicted ABC-type ATPase
MKQPIVYIIAGPNGAGKTTFAENFLPDFVHCREFLNADLIAAGLSPFSPETQDLRAGRLLLTRIKELVAAKQSFAFETTLSGRTYVRLLKHMKEQGYSIVLLFLWLPDVNIAISRVKSRVEQGGHNIPTSVIQRRYASGLKNLFQLYRPLADVLKLFDASCLPPKEISNEDKDGLKIFDADAYDQISSWRMKNDRKTGK